MVHALQDDAAMTSHPEPLTTEELRAAIEYRFPATLATRALATLDAARAAREPLDEAEAIIAALEAIGVQRWPDYPGAQYLGAQRDRAVRAVAAALAPGSAPAEPKELP